MSVKLIWEIRHKEMFDSLGLVFWIQNYYLPIWIWILNRKIKILDQDPDPGKYPITQCCGSVTIFYGSGSGFDFEKVTVPVPVLVPTYEKLGSARWSDHKK